MDDDNTNELRNYIQNSRLKEYQMPNAIDVEDDDVLSDYDEDEDLETRQKEL